MIRMRALLLSAFCALACWSAPARADLAVLDGAAASQTIFDFTCFTSKHCTAHVNIKSDGTELFTASAPGYVNAVGTAQGASTASINGGLVLCASTTAAAGGSNTTSNAINCTTAGGLRIDGYSIAGTALGTPTNFGTSPGAVVAGSVNASVMYGTTAAVKDPCKTVAKTTLAIDQAADTQIISGTSSKKTYICSLALVAATADTVSVVVGTGTVCATNIVAMLGSTTDSQGVSLAVNGGLTFGNGDATVFGGLGSSADNVCIRQGGTARLAGTITYVQD